MHAIEELYFEKKYAEAARLARETLEAGGEGEIKSVLERYLARCNEKMEAKKGED